MPAVSKAQQRFMGMVYAVKKGEMSAPLLKLLKLSCFYVKERCKKDFASTKHKKLPNKVVAKEESNPRIPRKKDNLLTLRSILTSILMRIPKELFMV